MYIILLNKLRFDQITSERSGTRPYCVITSKIALKQVFMAFGRALPNHCFVGKNMTVF